MKTIYKATRSDITMNTDTEFQKKLIKWFFQGILIFTVGSILIINFWFHFMESLIEVFVNLYWDLIYLIT